MDEFIKQGHWWWLLLVPVATFVFALLGSWWGATLGKVTEHQQWLRNQKQIAYVDTLNWSRDLENWSRTAWKKDPETRKIELAGLLADVKVTPTRMLAPKHVTHAVDDMLQALLKHAQLVAKEGHAPGHEEYGNLYLPYIESRRAVGEHIRKDLGVP